MATILPGRIGATSRAPASGRESGAGRRPARIRSTRSPVSASGYRRPSRSTTGAVRPDRLAVPSLTARQRRPLRRRDPRCRFRRPRSGSETSPPSPSPHRRTASRRSGRPLPRTSASPPPQGTAAARRRSSIRPADSGAAAAIAATTSLMWTLPPARLWTVAPTASALAAAMNAPRHVGRVLQLAAAAERDAVRQPGRRGQHGDGRRRGQSLVAAGAEHRMRAQSDAGDRVVGPVHWAVPSLARLKTPYSVPGRPVIVTAPPASSAS